MKSGPGVLLIASTGGHLAQLHQLADRIPAIAGRDRTWVTFDTPQSRRLLAGEDVEFVRYTAPRDWINVARNTGTARRLISSGRFGSVFSTGSAIALSFLPLAAARGLRVTYIESAARSDGPSLTGRMLARMRRIEVATQYPVWADDRWVYAGSVLDRFEPAPEAPAAEIRRALVMLGTIPYPFPRLVRKVQEVLPDSVEVVWQTGDTDPSGLGERAHKMLPNDELAGLVERSDVVIAHAGTGSALDALSAGKHPILVPRRAEYGEHVDDHQVQIAAELDSRGLATNASVEEIDLPLLERAARRRVAPVAEPPPLDLGSNRAD